MGSGGEKGPSGARSPFDLGRRGRPTPQPPLPACLDNGPLAQQSQVRERPWDSTPCRAYKGSRGGTLNGPAHLWPKSRLRARASTGAITGSGVLKAARRGLQQQLGPRKAAGPAKATAGSAGRSLLSWLAQRPETTTDLRLLTLWILFRAIVGGGWRRPPGRGRGQGRDGEGARGREAASVIAGRPEKMESLGARVRRDGLRAGPTWLLSQPQRSPHHPAAAPLCAAARAAAAVAASSFFAQYRLLSCCGSLRRGARSQASGSAAPLSRTAGGIACCR